jgi:cell division transport system permease protein
MGTTLKRIIIAGWQNFSRDGGIAVATIFILVMVIFLVSTIFLSKDVSQFLITSLQEKADISVYFKEFVLENDILKIKEKLFQLPEVKNVEYISKEEAIRRLVAKHPQLIESVKETEEMLKLATLNVSVFEANQYQAVVNFLENSNFKDSIDFVDYFQRKPVIERIFSLTSLATKTGIFLSIVLIITAILVTFNTIRLAILNSIEEIKIQRLVGASNWFIRGPFLVQGAISGTIATLISLSILSLICWFLSPKIEFFFAGLNLFNLFIKNFWILLLIQFSTGILLAVISSTIAIRKYLKV